MSFPLETTITQAKRKGFKSIFLVLTLLVSSSMVLVGCSNSSLPETEKISSVSGVYMMYVDQFSQLIKANPNDANSYYNRGNAYNFFGRREEAQEDYAMACRLDQELCQK